MHRLRRLGEVFVETPVYFITACTFEKRRILAEAGVHGAFRSFCTKAADHGAFVGQYVLMPDHLHLFVCIPTGELKLSMWVKSLKNSLSKHWRGGAIKAPHWQKGFFDHVLRSDESRAAKWRYVFENPVRAGLAERAEDWSYAGRIMLE